MKWKYVLIYLLGASLLGFTLVFLSILSVVHITKNQEMLDDFPIYSYINEKVKENRVFLEEQRARELRWYQAAEELEIVNYSEWLRDIQQKKINKVTWNEMEWRSSDGRVLGKENRLLLEYGGSGKVFLGDIPSPVENTKNQLIHEINLANLELSKDNLPLILYYAPPAESILASRGSIWIWVQTYSIHMLFAIALAVVAMVYVARTIERTQAQQLAFLKIRLRLAKKTSETFDDIGGADEAKKKGKILLAMLENPFLFLEMGGEIPQGVLLHGPPGTGKTLLARAIANAAKVPFYEISSTEFAELFTGVGAARVRDLFEFARKNSPCIIFVDEIDAVARAREAGGSSGSKEEREAVLYQFLTEMDGFYKEYADSWEKLRRTREANNNSKRSPKVPPLLNKLIIIIAATNRKELLDAAILRGGRFSLQISLPPPELEGRKAILRIHARGKKIPEDKRENWLANLARDTPNFSGAELKVLLAEAANRAATLNKSHIDEDDLEIARQERLDSLRQTGELESFASTPRMKKITGGHQAGHTTVTLFLDGPEFILPVSVIRGRPNFVQTFWFSELRERFKQNYFERDKLLDLLAIYSAGRIAEEIIFDGVSTTLGDEDMEKRTELAWKIVAESAMLGEIRMSYGTGVISRGITPSPELKRKMEELAEALCKEREERARTILMKNKALLLRLSAVYEAEEDVSKERIMEIVSEFQLEDPKPKNNNI